TIIDGQTTILSEWIITLAPKRLGQLVIPSFSVGNHNSQPIRITVLSPEQAGLEAIIFQAKPQMAIGQEVEFCLSSLGRRKWIGKTFYHLGI
ncbi:MAG TPA: hypothetical protein DD706_20700, partial [Nitrospiraceae bacterium]|nr:hypothetical protein [Nitrospiraceae bacterium]